MFLFGKSKNAPGFFFLWNILLRLFLPVEALIPTAVLHHHHHRPSNNYNNKKYDNEFSNNSNNWSSKKSPAKHYTYQHSTPASFRAIEYYPLQPMKKTFDWNPSFSLKKQVKCDGRDNLLQDLGVVAIVLGTIGTLMGIFSASYFSVVGNTISVISGLLSFATGIPSAILTYLAASDRLSYTISNVLSLISIANTFYSFWSVEFGNKDILTSQIANLIGVISLILSIVTAFPEVFDAAVYQIGKKSPEARREVNRFVRNYGCSGDDPTFYKYTQNIIRQLANL